MEDVIKLFKVEYLSNEDDLQWKTTSKYLMLNISATTDQIFPKFNIKLRGPNQNQNENILFNQISV